VAIYTNNIVSDSVIENPWRLRTVSYRAQWHVRSAVNNRSITHDATNQCGLARTGWAHYSSDSLVNGQVEIPEDRVRTQRPGNVNAIHRQKNPIFRVSFRMYRGEIVCFWRHQLVNMTHRVLACPTVYFFWVPISFGKIVLDSNQTTQTLRKLRQRLDER
jgi:hypothetical protein